MVELLWIVSTAIVLFLALGAVLHPAIPTGIVGTAAIGTAILCGMAGLGEEPRPWVVGATASMAVAGCWALWRWTRRGQ